MLPEIELAVVPVGACEQHGPNTTFNTDTARAYGFSKMIGERFGSQVLVCPPVPYGISVHHMAFPGTVTLRCETYINLLTDIAVALSKHGIRRIVFLNGHGGNSGSLSAVINILKYEHGIDAYYSGIGLNLFEEGITPGNGLVGEFGTCQRERDGSGDGSLPGSGPSRAEKGRGCGGVYYSR